MDDDIEDGDTIEEDYYAFLNISRTATNEEISNAYRKLSRVYHPDKHVEPEKKKHAENLFNKTKRAYEVLIDPHQRAIYDSLGIRGLETEGWEIIQRTRTPQEIREEYERLAREREQRRLEQRTNPKGNVTVNINATELFSTYEDEYEEFEDVTKGFPNIEVSGMSFAHSIEAPITTKDTVTLSGNLATHNGTGSGAVNVALRKIVSDKSWVECGIGAGDGATFSIKGFRTLTKRLFGTAIMLFQYSPSGIRPGLVTSLSYQLDKHMVGDLTWRAGIQSSMSTSIHRNTEKSITSLTFLFGVPHSYVSLSYSRKFYEHEKSLKLKIAVKAGTFGALLEYGAEKQVSKQSAVAASVVVGVPTGVTLKLKLNRANQTYSFPILLCEEVLPSPIFYATITPLFTWVLLKKLVIDPVKKEQHLRNKEKQKQANRTRMAEMQREAKAAKELMKETFSRIRSEEEAKRGLLIIHATYGRSTAQSTYSEARQQELDSSLDSEVIDVTVQLQVLVKDSKLFIHESSKSQLPGFYDPCVGEEKSLFVQYLFHGVLHEVSVNDHEPLKLPKKSDRVSET
ncbi:hypothetical protein RUM44_006761 [Polyplax serrata]|uniref:J domain-containing protein n=1 Tax=Polyplax serrata TaxID=468196 RepID=A0ABR1AIZ6_POLSC